MTARAKRDRLPVCLPAEPSRPIWWGAASCSTPARCFAVLRAPHVYREGAAVARDLAIFGGLFVLCTLIAAGLFQRRSLSWFPAILVSLAAIVAGPWPSTSPTPPSYRRASWAPLASCCSGPAALGLPRAHPARQPSAPAQMPRPRPSTPTRSEKLHRYRHLPHRKTSLHDGLSRRNYPVVSQNYLVLSSGAPSAHWP